MAAAAVLRSLRPSPVHTAPGSLQSVVAGIVTVTAASLSGSTVTIQLSVVLVEAGATAATDPPATSMLASSDAALTRSLVSKASRTSKGADPSWAAGTS